MTADEAEKYLWDADIAAERIARFTVGRSFDDYIADDLLRAAVERQFEIIGEAFTGLRRADPRLAERIPDLPRIIAFRNVLIHAYATVTIASYGMSSSKSCPRCAQQLPNYAEPRRRRNPRLLRGQIAANKAPSGPTEGNRMSYQTAAFAFRYQSRISTPFQCSTPA